MSATSVIGFVLKKSADLPNKSNVLSPHDYVEIERVTLDFFYIQAFCEHAEMRRDPIVRRWVTKTRDLAYRMEDVLDTIVIMEDEFPQSNHGKMETIKGILKISRRAYNYRKTINSLKKEINQIQLEFVTVYTNLTLPEINAISEQRSRPQPMPNIDSDIIVYTSEKDNILRKLLDTSTPRRAVVSIVGIAGIGKTALAINVFSRYDVSKHFALKIWVSVSEELDFCDLLSKVLKQINPANVTKHEDHTKEYLCSAIQRLLSGKRYLIVLDHVARENFRVKDASSPIADAFPDENHGSRILLPEKFRANDALSPIAVAEAFPDENNGSRILLTTRSLYVAKEADPNTEPCELQFLTSYEDLPDILKLCFLYLAAFPKGYEICTQSLIHMWVAEGLITLTYGTVLEEEAERFLEELAQRFMIQVSRRSPEGSITCFRVNPVLHDFAIKKSKEVKMVTVCSNEYFDPEDFRRARRVAVHHLDSKVMRYTSPVVRSLFCFKYPIPELGRHRMLRVLSCMGGKMEGEMKLEKLIEMTQLRYLKIGGLGDPGNLLSRMKRLQTIDLREGDHGDLPDYIWQVKTLRHVMLKGYTFGPTSSANLPNLRTLTGIKNKESWETRLPTLPNLCELDVQLSQGSPWSVIVNLLNTLQHLVHLNIVGDEVPTRVVMRGFPFYNSLRSLSLKEDRPEYYGYKMAFASSISPEHFSQLILENFRLKQDPMPVLEKNVPTLKILRLGYRSFENDKMSCSAGGFANLEKLELFVLEKLKEWEIEDGAMPKLQELKVSCCPQLSVPQGLRYLTNLQELSWASHDSDPKKEKEIRNICGGGVSVSVVDLSR